ncbi:glycosyl transferase family 39 [Acuticoccus sediminis]|uniref:Glycosyl transferase family 39 n=1 Tax=Acuticoccus sediminis TaxID=2184697 RepID=A0A8B2NJS6_9HYPH|nr:glycosyltransferase family 39 protein [Acuticoccus sediminis]RAH99725.1 glycosyl transferase family 39 [Acuticoccus sediminis]
MSTPPTARPHDGSSISVWASIALVLLVFLAYVPGFATVPPLDRDEPRYTQATKQMVETGDYVQIRFQDAPRNKKPIGIHWLQAAAVWASGDGNEAPLWVYRMPSIIGAIAAVLLSVWMARAFLPLGGALIVGGLLGATVIVGVEARLAKTDAVLLATVVLMQGALARVWLREAKGWAAPIAFWVGLALGVLVKGPIAPMVAVLSVLVLSWRSGWSLVPRLRPLVGVLILALICLPWFVAIWRATDGAFFANALGRDFLGKAATGQEGHWAPPLTHAALFFVVAWPLAPFFVAAARGFFSERSAALLFAAAWAIPSWIVFEITPTKLPHYTLPLLPAIALAVVAVLGSAEPPRFLRRLASFALIATPLGLVLVALAAPAYIASAVGLPINVTGILFSWVTPIAVVAIGLGVVAGMSLWRGRAALSLPVVGAGIASAAVAQALAWGLIVPNIAPLWVSPTIVRTADAVSSCPDPRIASVGGFNEPSLIFLAGTDTALTGPEEAVALAEKECVVIVSRERTVAGVRAAAEAAGVTLREPATVTGFNISKGDPVRLTFFVKEAP